jgi:SAM-dependent methyltransferase
MTNLYSEHAQEFSNTRQSAWIGWDRLLKNETLMENSNRGIKILDLGCGNGRFLKRVLDSELKIESYLGLDNSDILLNIAKKEFKDIKNAEFIKLDLETNWEETYKFDPSDYNLITAFGVMHHITTFENRKMIYQKAFDLLQGNGIFCVTYWQFINLRNLINKAKKIGENDFELTFGSSGATRFAHYSDESEIKDLEKDIA